MRDNSWLWWLIVPFIFLVLLVGGETYRWLDSGGCPFGVAVACESSSGLKEPGATWSNDPVGAALDHQVAEDEYYAEKDRQYQTEETERLRQEVEGLQDELERIQDYTDYDDGHWEGCWSGVDYCFYDD